MGRPRDGPSFGRLVMEGLQELVRSRLPLADATLKLFGYVFAPERLAKIFEEHRGRHYQDVLSFATLTNLVVEALTQHGGSGHACFSKAVSEQRLPVAEANCY